MVNGAFMVLKGHRSIVNQVRFNPHTYMICSSGVEKVIKVSRGTTRSFVHSFIFLLNPVVGEFSITGPHIETLLMTRYSIRLLGFTLIQCTPVFIRLGPSLKAKWLIHRAFCREKLLQTQVSRKVQWKTHRQL